MSECHIYNASTSQRDERYSKHIANLHDITIEKMEVMPDHIHMLISFKLKYSATNIVKALKVGSARIFLRNHSEIKQKQYWDGHLWSRSYYMGTLLH
ncbi:IS200/IS605 family transposase [Lactobacillus sp. MRS-253-APC-2B]|nr:IS200/IS605 family transposase [Lactobacillus sp. MRS-253-APC-2B]